MSRYRTRLPVLVLLPPRSWASELPHYVHPRVVSLRSSRGTGAHCAAVSLRDPRDGAPRGGSQKISCLENAQIRHRGFFFFNNV